MFDCFSAAGLTAQRFPQFNSCAMTPRRRMQSGCVFNFQERKDSINQTSADFYAYSSSFSYKKEKSERISHWEDTVRIILIFGRSVVKGSELSGHHLPNRSPAKRVRFGSEKQPRPAKKPRRKAGICAIRGCFSLSKPHQIVRFGR